MFWIVCCVFTVGTWIYFPCDESVTSFSLVWFDTIISLSHKLVKDSLFVLLPEQDITGFSFTYLVPSLLCIAFWRFFPVFLETSISTKSKNFAWFDRTNHKNFSRCFFFSATAIAWLQSLILVQFVSHKKLPFWFNLMWCDWVGFDSDFAEYSSDPEHWTTDARSWRRLLAKLNLSSRIAIGDVKYHILIKK